MAPSGTKVEQTGQETWPLGGRWAEFPGRSAEKFSAVETSQLSFH